MEDLSAVPQENSEHNFLFISISISNKTSRKIIVNYLIRIILLVIDYLLDRLQRGKIYTWIGTLLLAINPSGEITVDDIYDLSRTNEYDNICSLTHKEVAPHIFAVAAKAHYRIIQGLGKPSQVNTRRFTRLKESLLRNLLVVVFLLQKKRVNALVSFCIRR